MAAQFSIRKEGFGAFKAKPYTFPLALSLNLKGKMAKCGGKISFLMLDAVFTQRRY